MSYVGVYDDCIIIDETCRHGWDNPNFDCPKCELEEEHRQDMETTEYPKGDSQ